MASLEAIHYMCPINCRGCTSIFLGVCYVFTIMHGVQGALVAGDMDFLPQGLCNVTIIARLPHE
jgi:hypothetical protein